MVQLVFIAQQYARALGRWGARVERRVHTKMGTIFEAHPKTPHARVVSSTPIIRCDNPSDDTLAKRVS